MFEEVHPNARQNHRGSLAFNQLITEVSSEEEQPLQLTTLQQAHVKVVWDGLERDYLGNIRDGEAVVCRLGIAWGYTSTNDG